MEGLKGVNLRPAYQVCYTHVGYIMEGGMSKRQALYDRYDGRNGSGEK
ncbi:hypothetical protein [Bacillus sp. ISL-4]|nr:hypothetical protein [Bacillus sp. ISL-4]